MKSLFFILLFSQMAFAQLTEREFNVVTRTGSNTPMMGVMTLKDFVSNDSFDGEYFKIVVGKGDEAVRFDAEDEMVFRAATAYYHLTKARDYFVNEVKSEYVRAMPKMVVRIQLTNQFVEVGHFANDNYEPQYNNALTIPAGTGLASRGVKPWGTEIWFRPQKRLHISEIKVNDMAGQEFKSLMGQFRKQIHMQSLQSFFAQLIGSAVNNAPVAGIFTVENIIRLVGSSVIIEGGYQFIDPITKFFSRKWYWLDTGLVPEIIYHEYSHAALADHLKLSHSTAIIEGMADFFASQISDSQTIAKKIHKYNTYNGKDAKQAKNYRLQFEMGEYANTDFVFGLLWNMNKKIKENYQQRLSLKADKNFLYELRKNLTTNASIRNELIDAVEKTCNEVCEEPFISNMELKMYFNARGI